MFRLLYDVFVYPLVGLTLWLWFYARYAAVVGIAGGFVFLLLSTVAMAMSAANQWYRLIALGSFMCGMAAGHKVMEGLGVNVQKVRGRFVSRNVKEV
jgi:hypothetical protein